MQQNSGLQFQVERFQLNETKGKEFRIISAKTTETRFWDRREFIAAFYKEITRLNYVKFTYIVIDIKDLHIKIIIKTISN